MDLVAPPFWGVTTMVMGGLGPTLRLMGPLALPETTGVLFTVTLATALLKVGVTVIDDVPLLTVEV